MLRKPFNTYQAILSIIISNNINQHYKLNDFKFFYIFLFSLKAQEPS